MKNDEVVRLFDLYAGDLFRFALSYMGSKQDAEDVVQEVFLKLLNKTVFLKVDYEKAYLMKMTANGCKNLLKSPAHKTGVDLEAAAEELACFYELGEDDKEVYDALMKMDETLRIPLYLHYYEDYSYKDAAKFLKISESAVAMRIKRGKEELRERLEKSI